MRVKTKIRTIAAALLTLLLGAITPKPATAQANEVPSTQAPGAGAFSFPSQGDFSGMRWTQAFFAMHDFFSHTYAFGEWKRIPWDKMAAAYGRRIAESEAAGDKDAYRIAMVEYLKEIPDGHVKLATDVSDLKDRFIGGSYGLGLARLDDGSIVAAAVRPDGPAGKAGVPAGARIVSWNGAPADKALLAADTRWFRNAATLDDLNLERLLGMARAPVGARATIAYEPPRSSADAGIAMADIAAERDGYADLGLFDPAPVPSMTELRKNVVWRIDGDGIGYLRIYHVIHFDDITKYPTEVTAPVAEALTAFKKAGVDKLILDLRGNRGGSDQVGADISGLFAGEKSFYERTAWYNASSGRFDLAYSDLFAQTFALSDKALWVIPGEPRFAGEIVVLVNPATISSGEGIALAIGRLPNANVMGFYGTHGSFGLIPWPVAMPEGIDFEYPIGRSLDASGRIQVDADWSGSGGVQPTARVPLDAEAAAAYASGVDVELAYAREWLRSH